jgi:hypothetical protein
MHGNWLRFELFQDIFEPAIFSEGRNLVGKKHAQTQPINAGAQRAVDLVAADPADNWNRDIPPPDLEIPFASRCQTRMSNAAVFPDIVRHLWNAI